MRDFFVSYNQADCPWAEWIAWQLEEAGYTTVLQAWDFLPGQNFVLRMQEATSETTSTIALLSPNYLTARFTQSEWAAAFVRDPTGDNGLLVPVRVRTCDLRGLLPQIIYIDLVGLDEVAARDALLTGVCRRRAKPIEAPVFPEADQRSVPKQPFFPGPSSSIQNLKDVKRDSDVIVGTGGLNIKITIARDFSNYTVEEKNRLLRVIGELLDLKGNVIISHINLGSIKLTLDLPPEKAEELLWAIKSGKLSNYGVVDAEIKDPDEGLVLGQANIPESRIIQDIHRIMQGRSFSSDVEKSIAIKMIGVGGSGGKIVESMIETSVRGIEFITTDTDRFALESTLAPVKILLGAQLTNGLGAGANPEIARKAAYEDHDAIAQVLEGADMLFLAAGMGGGTGTGAAPVIASIAREKDILTVGVVSTPFRFEGRQRQRQAVAGLHELHKYVDTLIVIPNQRLLETVDRDTSLREAFKVADGILRQAVQGISDVITVPGLINLGLADVRHFMERQGGAVMGIGAVHSGADAITAVQRAIDSPWLDSSIDGAQKVWINITGGAEISLLDVYVVVDVVKRAAHPKAEIIFGAVIDEHVDNTIRVTVIATALNEIASTNLPEEIPNKGEIPNFELPLDSSLAMLEQVVG